MKKFISIIAIFCCVLYPKIGFPAHNIEFSYNKSKVSLYRESISLYRAKLEWAPIYKYPAISEPFLKANKNVVMMQLGFSTPDGWIPIIIGDYAYHSILLGYVNPHDVKKIPTPTNPYDIFKFYLRKYNFLTVNSIGLLPFRSMTREPGKQSEALVTLNHIFLQSVSPDTVKYYMSEYYALWVAANPADTTDLILQFNAYNGSKFGYVQNGKIKIFPKVNLGRGETKYPLT